MDQMNRLLPSPLFGTSGVRGRTNVDITPELAYRIGEAYGRILGAGAKAAIAHDTRAGAQMLSAAAASGFASQGVSVSACGVLPSPAFSCLLASGGFAGGILVTGSHLPPEMNGIIPMLSDGRYAPASVTSRIELAMKERGGADFAAIGSIAPHPAPMEPYARFLLSRIGDALKGFRIALDPGNGTASRFLSSLLRSAGAEVHCINDMQSPSPARSAEPRAVALGPLASLVTERGCALGAAFDIDADRVLFVDELGKPLSEDLAGAIFTDFLLSKSRGRPMLTPVNSSNLADWMAGKRHFPLVRCRIGQPVTQEAMVEHRPFFAYEESGKYYFPDEGIWCDGMLATAILARMLAEGKTPLSEIAGRYPKYCQVKEKLALVAERREEVVAKVDAAAPSELGHGLKGVDRLDGLKLQYDDAWLLLRASGTEPLFRVYSDASDAKRAEELAAQGVKLVKRIIGESMGGAS